MVWPVTYDASSLARNTATCATSSGSPMRPSGVRDRIFLSASRLPSTAVRASCVRMVPGPMPFTRMPWVASEIDITLVSWLIAPFETTYGTWLGMARTAFTLDMLTMAPPPPCFTIWRAAAWPARKMPFRFTAITRSKSASSMSRNSAACTMPALATRTSRRPNALTAAATALSTWALRETSQAAKLTVKPSAVRRSVSRRPASSFTSVRSTRAPSRAKARAHARPMPCAAPVTRATLSASLTRLLRLGLHRFGELRAEFVETAGAAGAHARIDHLVVVLRRRALDMRVDEILVLRVLAHRAGERVHALPVHQHAHQRVGVALADLVRVAVAIILPRLVQLRPVEHFVDRLLGRGGVGLGARLVGRLRRGEGKARESRDPQARIPHGHAALPERFAACESRSRTLRAMPSASRPQSARSCGGSPCSTKWSGSPRRSSGTAIPAAASASATAPPAPPATTFSSTVTTRSWEVARR